MGFGCTTVLAGVFAFITWLELASGLAATTWTAFFNDVEVNEWAYGIFAIDIVFSVSILYYTGQETYFRGHSHSRRNLTSLCGMSTVMTMCLFAALYCYNIKVLESSTLNDVVLHSFFVYVSAVVLLALIGCCFLCDYLSPEEDSGGNGYHRDTKPPAPGSLEASLAKMVEHVEQHPLHKTYTLYSYGPDGTGSPFQVQMGWP